MISTIMDSVSIRLLLLELDTLFYVAEHNNQCLVFGVNNNIISDDLY